MTDLVISEEQIEKEALTLKQRAESMQVVTPEDWLTSAEFKKTLKDLDKHIVDFFEPMRKTADDAKNAILTKKNEARKPVLAAIDLIDEKRTIYYDKQECIRREVEAKAQREAEEVAKKERDRLLALAVKAEEKGKDEKAEGLLEQAEQVYVEPVFVAPTVAKTVKLDGGGSTTRIKDVEVTVVNPLLLIQEIAAGRVPITVIEVKAGALKTWVKATDSKHVPGLAIRETSREAVR